MPIAFQSLYHKRWVELYWKFLCKNKRGLSPDLNVGRAEHTWLQFSGVQELKVGGVR